jgi:sporulation protein YlmC with PRC-barrel domain
MEVPSSRTPNLDFKIGAEVQCRDDSCGKLSRVVIDPETEQVVALIVERGVLQKDSRVVPLRVVIEATPDTIRLDLESDALDNYTEYNETEYAVPAEGWEHSRYHMGEASYWAPPYRPIMDMPVMPMLRQTIHEGIPSTQEAIGKGTAVRDREGELGTVDRVLTNRESGAITHLVVKSAGLLSSDIRLLPIGMVSEVDDMGVIADLQGREFEDLPEYQPDKGRT